MGSSRSAKIKGELSLSSAETWDQLIRDGLIEDAPRSDGYLRPRWTLKTTYYWQQTFPAGGEVLIAHRYAPSVGGVVPMTSSDLLNDPSFMQIGRAGGLNRFCIDQEFLNAVAESRSQPDGEQRFVEYIRRTRSTAVVRSVERKRPCCW